MQDSKGGYRRQQKKLVPNVKPLLASPYSECTEEKTQKHRCPSVDPPPLIAEIIESAPRLSQPVDLLLKDSPLGGGVALFLKQPGIVLSLL